MMVVRLLVLVSAVILGCADSRYHTYGGGQYDPYIRSPYGPYGSAYGGPNPNPYAWQRSRQLSRSLGRGLGWWGWGRYPYGARRFDVIPRLQPSPDFQDSSTTSKQVPAFKDPALQ